jgi:hypothetical protein
MIIIKFTASNLTKKKENEIFGDYFHLIFFHHQDMHRVEQNEIVRGNFVSSLLSSIIMSLKITFFHLDFRFLSLSICHQRCGKGEGDDEKMNT